MKKYLNNRGSAMVWVVCALMVVSIIVAATLAISVSYYQEASEQASSDKAELLAQSGANYAVTCMNNRDPDKWLPMKVRDYKNADGSYIYLSSPFRVYFDDSVRTSIENWLQHSRYKNLGYDIKGTEVVFDDETVSLTEADKNSIIESNKSTNYAELTFMLDIKEAEGKDPIYILKIVSTAKNGNYTANCAAVFSGTVYIDANPKTGREEVSGSWQFLGYTDS